MCHTMAGLFYALLFLDWILCSYQLKLLSTPITLQRGSPEPVKLDCQPEGKDSMDHGVFWFRQREGGRSPESILFVTNMGKPILSNENVFKHFSAKKSYSYSLEINPFGEKDQAIYYCMINQNSVLHISPGRSLYYPAASQPTTSKAASPRIQHPTPGDSCDCKATQPGLKPSGPVAFSCSFYILAPLAGFCLLLLISLLVTSILLSKKSRRKRCRCKHRPTDEKNGKPKAPGRYV
ncbi:hypothetical protein FKM82_001708 [Ascaphus truei]